MNYLKSVLFLSAFFIGYGIQGAEAAARELGIALKEETPKITAHPLGQVVVERAAQGTLLQILPTELRTILSNYVMAARTPEEMAQNMRRFLEAPQFEGLIPATVRTAVEKFKIPEAQVVGLLNIPAARAWFLDELKLAPALKAPTLEWMNKFITNKSVSAGEVGLFNDLLLGATEGTQRIPPFFLPSDLRFIRYGAGISLPLNYVLDSLVPYDNPVLISTNVLKAEILLKAGATFISDERLQPSLERVLTHDLRGQASELLKILLERNSKKDISLQIKIEPLIKVLSERRMFYGPGQSPLQARAIWEQQMRLLEEYLQKQQKALPSK